MAADPSIRRLLLSSPLLIAACTLSLLRSPRLAEDEPRIVATTATLTVTSVPTFGSIGVSTASVPMIPPSPSGGPSVFCDDPRPLVLIGQFKEAVSSADGALLASLVSPEHGMDTRLLRDGRVVNYDQEHSAALFESSYIVDWGIGAGSGLPVKGSFRELIVPDLMDVFSRQYTSACNEIRLGGMTYNADWPYGGIDFYSLHYPGSSNYGSLDWHTWMIGIHFVGDTPYLYAILQFKWEP